MYESRFPGGRGGVCVGQYAGDGVLHLMGSRAVVSLWMGLQPQHGPRRRADEQPSTYFSTAVGRVAAGEASHNFPWPPAMSVLLGIPLPCRWCGRGGTGAAAGVEPSFIGPGADC